MARRVIQFPVRNAFAAQRSYDALARTSQERRDQPYRVSTQIENEIARIAEQQSTGRSAEFEAARVRSIIVLHPTSRITRLTRRFAATSAAIRSFVSTLFVRR